MKSNMTIKELRKELKAATYVCVTVQRERQGHFIGPCTVDVTKAAVERMLQHANDSHLATKFCVAKDNYKDQITLIIL